MCGISLSSKAGVDTKSYRLTQGIVINNEIALVFLYLWKSNHIITSKELILLMYIVINIYLV